MSRFDFSEKVPGFPAGKIDLDIYFQPALTWVNDSDPLKRVRGLALLFLENGTNLNDTQDFREMVKILIRWVWEAYWKASADPEPSHPGIADLEGVFEAFASESLSYLTDLEPFLENHFIFRIKKYTAGTDFEATVFPMFPHLELKIGGNSPVSFSSVTLTLTQIEDLKIINQQFRLSFDPNAQDSPDTIEAESLSEFVFTGYFRMLIRSGLQEIISSDRLARYERELAAAEASGDLNQIAQVQHPTFLDLLDALPDAQYQNIAGMASTFLMNGFRLPASIFGAGLGLYEATSQQFTFETAEVEKPLFKTITNADGEEEEVPDGTEIFYRITIQNPNGLSYLTKREGGNWVNLTGITYKIEANPDTNGLHQLSQGLQDVDVAPGNLPDCQPQLIPFYRPQPMNFALRQSVDWNNTDLLLPLPSSLKAHLLSQNPSVDLHVWPAGDYQQESAIDHTNFSWVSMIKFTVRRIPDTEGSGFLANTYELVEAGDEELKRLEDIFNFLDGNTETNPVDLYLAYAPSGGADLESLEPSSVAGTPPIRIFRSNLSTNTSAALRPAPVYQITSALLDKMQAERSLGQDNDFQQFRTLVEVSPILNTVYLSFQELQTALTGELLTTPYSALQDQLLDYFRYSPFSATLERGTDNIIDDTAFLQLVWEGCTLASGGYFLYVQPDDPQVDESWFRGEPSAALHLIIEFMKNDDPIHSFNNAVVVRNSVLDIETDLVIARSSATVPVLMIPPGHIGFRLERDEPPMNPADPLEEVSSLYHMLGFRLAANTAFNAMVSSIPVGPMEGAPQKWLYERSIPAYSLLLSPLSQDNRIFPTVQDAALPLENLDPYRGINPQEVLPVDCWWQDIYGNQLDLLNSDGRFPLGYTDPLIGLNQWPSVAENFHFREFNTNKIALEIKFTFDKTSYPDLTAPETITDKEKKRLQADLITYQKIYYQLIQGDISLKVKTSVDETWPIETDDGLDNQSLIDFVATIYLYLAALAHPDPGASAPSPYTPIVYVETFTRSKNAVSLPAKFIFKVEVCFQIERDEQYIHDDLKDNSTNKTLVEHQGVHINEAYLTPNVDGTTITVRDFASDFEKAFPDLRLAVGEDRLKKKKAEDIGRPYYAVQLGTAQGLSYDILEKNPAYFALPPLANTLLTGKVLLDKYPDDWAGFTYTKNLNAEEKEFEAIDLNILGREFLVAVEEFLKPESLIAAIKIDEAWTEEILQVKSSLADTISRSMDVVLLEDQGTGSPQEAIDAIKRELLEHLVKGYDIETAVQFEVEVKVGRNALTADWEVDKLPRLRGIAAIKNVWLGEDPNDLVLANQEDLDFSLSSGRIDLQKMTGPSTFTYLFDTKTPEKFAAMHLELEFRLTEIEYEIESVPGIPEFQASNWLSLVLPENLNTYQITSDLLLEVKDLITEKKGNLVNIKQIIDALKTDNRKNEEHSNLAELEATILQIITQVEYDKVVQFFDKELLQFSRPIYAITKSRWDTLTTDLDSEIDDQTVLKGILGDLTPFESSGQEYSTLLALESAMETEIGNVNYDLIKDLVLPYIHPIYRIEDMNNTSALSAVWNTLSGSKIKSFEFISLNGLKTGLRKTLGAADYMNYEADLVDAAQPRYRLEKALIDRLILQLTSALSCLGLFKLALAGIKVGTLFKKEFFSLPEFDTALKKELGRLSYEKYQGLIQKYTKPFFQITDARLDLLEAHFRGKALEGDFQLVADQLRSSNSKGGKFFTETDFETAVVLEITQASYDPFKNYLLRYFNPHRITNSLLDSVQIEMGSPPDTEEQLILKYLGSARLKNCEFVAIADFKTAVAHTLGNKFFHLFREQLEPFRAPFYRIRGAMITDLNQAHASSKRKNIRARKIRRTINASNLKNSDPPFFSLQALEDATKNVLGEESYTKYKNVLEGPDYVITDYRIVDARLDGLTQKQMADLTALEQFKQSLLHLEAANTPAREFLSPEELEEDIKALLGPDAYENLRAQTLSFGLQTYAQPVTRVIPGVSPPQLLLLSNPVYRITDALLDQMETDTPSAQATAFTGFRSLLGSNNLVDKEYLTFAELETAISNADSQSTYTTFKGQLSHYVQPVFRISNELVDELLAQATTERTELGLFQGFLAKMDGDRFKSRRFSTLMKFAIRCSKKFPGPNQYQKFREELLNAVQPFYRIKGAMLNGLQAVHNADLASINQFKNLLTTLENLAFIDQDHASLEALDEAITQALEPSQHAELLTYKNIKHRLLGFAGANFKITAGALSGLQQDIADETTAFPDIPNFVAVDSLTATGQVYDSLEALDVAFSQQISDLVLAENYATYKHRLLDLAGPNYGIGEIGQKLGDEIDVLNIFSSWLQNSGGDIVKSYADQDDLEQTLINAQIVKYERFRMRLLNLADSDFEITQAALDVLSTEVSSEITALGDFKTDYLVLKPKVQNLSTENYDSLEALDAAIILEIAPDLADYEEFKHRLLGQAGPFFGITAAARDNLASVVQAEGPSLANFENLLSTIAVDTYLESPEALDETISLGVNTVQYEKLTKYKKFKDRIVDLAGSTFTIAQTAFDDSLLEVNADIATFGDIWNFDAVLSAFRDLDLTDQDYASLADLDQAIAQNIDAAQLNNYTTLKDRLLNLAGSNAGIAEAALVGLEREVAAEIAALSDLEDLQLVLGYLDPALIGVSHGSADALHEAIILEIAPDLADYEKYKHRLLALIESRIWITQATITGLVAEADAEMAALGLFGTVLQTLDNSADKDTEYFELEALESLMETELGASDYVAFRGQLLNFARPIYRLNGAMLDDLNAKATAEEAALTAFEDDMDDLKDPAIRPIETREYASRDEMERGFEEALIRSGKNHAVKEQRLQMFKDQNLTYSNSIYRIEASWLADIKLKLDTQMGTLALLGDVLELLADSTFGDPNPPIMNANDFRTTLETDIDGEFGTGSYATIKDHLLVLNDPVIHFSVPETPPPDAGVSSQDQEEFSAIKQVLKDSRLNGRDFDSTAELENELKKTLGDPDYQLFRSYAPMFTNPNYMGKSPVPIPLRDYPMPPSLVHQEAAVDESSRTDLEDIRQWEYSIIYEHEDIAQDSIDCLIQLNVLQDVITLSSNTVSEDAGTTSPFPIGDITVQDPLGTAYQLADLSLSGPDLGSFQIAVNIAGKFELQLQSGVLLDYETKRTYTIVIAATPSNDTSRMYSQEFTIRVLDVDEAPLVQDRDLFQALVNFNEIYPALAADLALLKLNHDPAKKALLAFKTLAEEVATAWKAWRPDRVRHQPGSGDLHYVISEELIESNVGSLKEKQGFILPQGRMLQSRLGADDPEPLLALPGYQQDGDPVWDETPMKIYTFIEDPFDQTFFGDSSIPDRKFTVENLDVIEHQNAWSSVWLSRNKILVAGRATNPKFVFQTPAVRFTNSVTPFITNDEPWDLATLHSPDDQPEDKPLLEHMNLMLGLIAPDTAGTGILVDYEVRLSCRYVFALAEGTGLNVDIKPTLPILMGLRLNPTDLLDSGDRLLTAYPKMLTDEINLWLALNDPVRQNASLIFSVNLFSKLDPNSMTSLPMLRIKQLELNLKNIL